MQNSRSKRGHRWVGILAPTVAVLIGVAGGLWVANFFQFSQAQEINYEIVNRP